MKKNFVSTLIRFQYQIFFALHFDWLLFLTKNQKRNVQVRFFSNDKSLLKTHRHSHNQFVFFNDFDLNFHLLTRNHWILKCQRLLRRFLWWISNRSRSPSIATLMRPEDYRIDWQDFSPDWRRFRRVMMMKSVFRVLKWVVLGRSLIVSVLCCVCA